MNISASAPQARVRHPRSSASLITAGGEMGTRPLESVEFPVWQTFTALEELNRQARLWRDQVAHQRPWPDDDLRTVEQAFAAEQPRLLPLPAHPFEADLVLPILRARRSTCVST